MSKPIVIEQFPEPIETPRGSLMVPVNSAVSGSINYSRLRELEPEYKAYLLAELYSPGSVSTYTKEVRRLLSWLEANPQLIGRDTFLRYRDYLRARYPSPSSVNLAMVGARRYLNWLYDIGEIPNNPALGVKGIRQGGRGKAHKKDALTPGEVRKLLGMISPDTAIGARDRALIGAMLYGGLRTIEAMRALIGHYKTKQDRRILLLQGKGKSEAGDYVVIVPELEDMLGDWLAYHPNGSDPKAPLFCSLSRRTYGRALSSSGVRRMVKLRFKEAGIRDSSKSTHSLRHSAISAVIRGGGTLLQAQTFARHESPDTTQIYIHTAERLENPPELLIQY